MEKQMQGHTSHARHWAILVGCCLLCGFNFTIPMLSFGVFISPLVASFQCSATEISIYFTFTAAAAALSSAFGARILRKSMRATVVVFSLACALAYTLLTLFPAVPMVWLAGVVAGFSFALCATVLVPIAINTWFAKRQGTFIGLAFAMVGVFGMVFSPLFTAIIGSAGWQVALRVAALMVAVVGVFVAVFLLRESPVQEGLVPYGAEDTSAGEVPAQAVGKATEEPTAPSTNIVGTPAFWLCALAAMLGGFMGDFNAQLNTVAQSSGFDAVVAGFALSSAAAGLMVGKLFMGWLKDLKGSTTAIIVGCAIGVVAFATYLAGIMTGTVALLYVGAFLTGFATCLGTLSAAVLSADAFDAASYAKGVAYMTAFCSLGMAVGIPFYSLTYDTLGSYVPILIACIVVPAACAVISAAGIKLGKRAMQAEA